MNTRVQNNNLLNVLHFLQKHVPMALLGVIVAYSLTLQIRQTDKKKPLHIEQLRSLFYINIIVVLLQSTFYCFLCPDSGLEKIAKRFVTIEVGYFLY